jgi:signal transduction histidine kinase
MRPDTVKVLLVDDNREDALLTKAMLAQGKSTHFIVDLAFSYDDALDRLTNTSYNLCLADLKLDIDHDALELMRTAVTKGFHAPFVVLTGMEDSATEALAIHGGAADYLIKGHFEPEMLERVIRHALERQFAQDELKRIEVELRTSRDELEERVQQRAAELSKAVAALQTEITRRIGTEQQLREAIVKLERHNKEKSEFVANVSHELKTPLTSIMYGTRNLLKGIAGPLPDQANRYLQMFDSECERLVSTIDRILDLSRLDNHALTVNPVTTPLRYLISRTQESLRVQIETARLTLDIGTTRGLDFVLCDPGMVQRVLQNILSNAIKFTPVGGRISIAIVPGKDSPGMAAISVTDNGIGIPPAALQRVTERYFRVGTHISGTGLGLAISKEIIHLHGGSLDIASPPPDTRNGTCVTITLPVAPAPILIIATDNLSIQALLAAQLISRGYLVDSLTSGEAILQRAMKTPPNMILMDIHLEDMNGSDVILQLKEAPATRHVPIVAVTGASVDEETMDLLNRFSIPSLRKPWNMEELYELIESTLIGITPFQPVRQEEHA